MRRPGAAAILMMAALAACGGRGRGPDSDPRSVSVARRLGVYHELGMLAGPFDFQAVARFTTLAGPADSTLLILTMSMPNNALRFQRGDAAFFADYHVAAAILRDTVTVQKIDRTERVRVAGFAETTRTEESIVFQDMVTLVPGRYIVRLQVADRNSSRGFHALDTVDVPAYSANEVTLAPPVLVHQAGARNRVDVRPPIVINTRNTITYGSDDPRLYLELYGSAEPRGVRLRVVDDGDVVLWHEDMPMTEGDAHLRHATVAVPADSLPIGRVWIEAFALPGGPLHREPIMVIISDEWMVANFDEMLRFLRHIAYASEVDSLRKATGAARNVYWERFWSRRDPIPATPVNEFRDEFFGRIRVANDEFGEPGRQGWDTPRGTVFIVLGPPDYENERYAGRDTGIQTAILEWVYEDLPGGRTIIQFYDRTGFGRYELTPASEAAFNTLAAHLRPRS